MTDKIKIESGEKRKFSTGANKQAASGKGTPVLVPGDAILEVAKHFEGGVPIYGARNWEKGIPLSEILNSLERHLQQEKMGLTDEPHARALVWNALVYLATKLRIEKELLPAELDDMPKYPKVSNSKLNDIEWYCLATTCFNGGKANFGQTGYFCPKHKYLMPKEEEKPVDTMKSMAFDDGQWYCSEYGCCERGFSNVAPNTFHCDKHREGE